MLTRAAGPDWKADAGDEIDLPLNVAAGLVSGGYAEALDKPEKPEKKPDPAPAPAPTVETAAVEPAEQKAVTPKAQPRKRE
jgi:hypothetical protein